MGEQYIPQTLKDSGLAPVVDYQNVIYIRNFKGNKPESVFRIDPVRGICLAFWFTKTPERYLTETAYGVDEGTPKKEVEADEIKDSILVRLLSQENPEEILKDYPPEMCGALPSGSYRYSPTRNSRTFIIIDEKRPIAA